LASKIFYTIEEVSELTKLPQMLILHYLRVKGITLAPEHYPDINPRRVKGELLFSKKDVDEILRFIDKKKDETWEKWQLRRIKEIMAKRELNIDKLDKRPDLRIINGGKKDKFTERE
jgi:DNA-binding transcriptional MerR regulator